MATPEVPDDTFVNVMMMSDPSESPSSAIGSDMAIAASIPEAAALPMMTTDGVRAQPAPPPKLRAPARAIAALAVNQRAKVTPNQASSPRPLEPFEA